MHDHVVKAWKWAKDHTPHSPGMVLSGRLEHHKISRAMTTPISSQFNGLYEEVLRWLRLSDRLVNHPDDDPASVMGELWFSCRHLHVVLSDLQGFFERIEDNLADNEDITHLESKYDRDVSHFSKLASTEPLRTFLEQRAGFTAALAGEGAQVQGDLLKVVFMANHLAADTPKPTDLYAMMAELVMDTRHHLLPAFADGSPFMKALRKATERPPAES